MFKSKFSELDHHLQEVLKKASSALIIRVIGTLLGFAVSVLVARLLGVEGTGVYFLALSVATIVATIGRMGFDNTVVRFVASSASVGNWRDIAYVHHTVTRLVTLSSMSLSVVLFLSAEWMAVVVFDKPYMEIPFMLAAAAVLPLALAMIQAESLRGLKSIPASQWVKTVFVSLFTLALLYPFIQIWSENGAVTAFLIATCVSALLSHLLWTLAFREHVNTSVSEEKTLSVHNLFQSSWPLFGVALTGLVMTQAGTVFLGVWGSVEDVGIFNIANRVASLLLFPLMAMVSILTPKFAGMFKNNDMFELQGLARRSSKILTFIAVPVALAVAFSAEWILDAFGPDFKNGVLILDIFLIGVVVNASTGAVGSLLMMGGYEKSVRNITLSSSIFSVFLLVLLVPNYGGVGAAIGMVSGIVGQNLYLVWEVNKKLGFIPCTLWGRANAG